MGVTIDYDVDLRLRLHHLVEVTVHVPAELAADAVLAMATWTPGSYFLRHYSRQVQQVTATAADGSEVAVTMPDTTRWQLAADGSQAVDVRFEIYGNELGVRNNHVDDHHALLVGAATFPFVEGHGHLPHRVTIDAGGEPVWALLPQGDDGAYEADDHLHLVDAAFEVGDHRVVTWETAGIPHRLVWAGHGGHPDLEKVAAYCAKITDAAVALAGDLPLERDYTFLAVGSDAGGGGLEHRDGSVLMMPVTTFQDPEREAIFQSLVAHEYFHLWNVKRIIPEALVDPDITRPVHTPSLWVAEGWTAFFDEVIPVRAGVWTLDTYLKKAAVQVHNVLNTPGAARQSVRRASHEAWTKQYIRDENTPNVAVNYYPHGAVVAWCLDLLTRQHNPEGHGLDDAFRLLWQRFGKTGRGYTEQDVQDVVNEAAGHDLTAFFDQYVETPSLPPIRDLVEVVGLQFKDGENADLPWFGANVDETSGKVLVTHVLREGPAWQAGLTGGDEVVAIDGQRIPAGKLDIMLRAHKPGSKVEVAVARGPRLLTVGVELAPNNSPQQLVRVDTPTESQNEAFRRWLGASLQDVPKA